MPESMLPERNSWNSENLWKLIPVLPGILAGIAIYLGVNYEYAAGASAVLFLWVWYAHRDGPSPREDPEYDFLRVIRVRLYAVGLFLYILVVLVTIAVSPILALLIYGALFPFRALALRALFTSLTREDERLVSPRNKDEKLWFQEVWMRVAGSIIHLSAALAVVIALLIVEPYILSSTQISSPNQVVGATATIVIATVGSYLRGKVGFVRESESREYARRLADSLRKRHWARQFGNKL